MRNGSRSISRIENFNVSTIPDIPCVEIWSSQPGRRLPSCCPLWHSSVRTSIRLLSKRRRCCGVYKSPHIMQVSLGDDDKPSKLTYHSARQQSNPSHARGNRITSSAPCTTTLAFQVLHCNIFSLQTIMLIFWTPQHRLMLQMISDNIWSVCPILKHTYRTIHAF